MELVRHSSHPLEDEAGYTLPELLVAMTLGLLVAFGAMSMLMMAQKAEPRTSERAAQLQQGRVMVERLVRELRQGERVYDPAPASLEIVTRTSAASCGGASGPSVACRVAYGCAGTTCSRAVQLPDGTWKSEQVVSGIVGPNVFSYETPAGAQSPDYVAVELVFPNDSGSEAVSMVDGTQLRNWSESTGAA